MCEDSSRISLIILSGFIWFLAIVFWFLCYARVFADLEAILIDCYIYFYQVRRFCIE